MVILQLAVGGEWERAISFPLHAAYRASLRAWLADAHAQGECALEIVYPPLDRPQILGTRVRAFGFDALENLVASLFDSPAGVDWQSGIRLVRTHFGESACVPARIHAFEVGLFNAWRSEKAERVWTSGDEESSSRAFERLLNARNWWERTRPAPVLLEAAWTEPVEHWMAECISVRRRAGFVAQRSLLANALDVLLSPVQRSAGAKAGPTE